MQKALFDVTVIDTKAETVAFYAREIAESPGEAANKVMKIAESQGLVTPGATYHLHVVIMAPLSPSGVIVPNQATTKSILGA